MYVKKSSGNKLLFCPGGKRKLSSAHGLSFEFEYRGKYEFIFETKLENKSADQDTYSTREKISRMCTFKLIIEKTSQCSCRHKPR